MCKLKSAIVLKDRVYCPDHDSHDRMLMELNIKDTYENASSLFVRIELSPADGRVDSDVDDWRLKVDQDILPDWWAEEVDVPRIRAVVQAWCDVHVLRDGYHELRNGQWYLCGNASAKLYCNASAKLHRSASAKLYDSASAKLYDSASAKLYCNASAELYDNASAELHCSASAELYGSASAELYGNASAKLHRSASAKLYGNASAIIPANAWGHPTATVKDSAVLINHKTNEITSLVEWKQV